MKFGVLVNEGPYQHQASDSAYLFCRAAIDSGHEIDRVFFYHDGVNNATKYTEPPQDDRNVVTRWAKLAEEHGVDLVVCVAAALRRGIVEEGEAHVLVERRADEDHLEALERVHRSVRGAAVHEHELADLAGLARHRGPR